MSASSVNVFEVSNQVGPRSTEGELYIGEFALASLTVEGQCHSTFCFEPHNFTPAKESKTNRQTSSKIRKQDVKGAVVVSYYYAKQEEVILKISIIFHRYGFLEQIFIQYRSSRLLVYTSWCHKHKRHKNFLPHHPRGEKPIESAPADLAGKFEKTTPSLFTVSRHFAYGAFKLKF